jgi:hypothetical protein
MHEPLQAVIMQLNSPASPDSCGTLLSPAAPTVPHTCGQTPSPSSSAQSGSTSEGAPRATNRAAIRRPWLTAQRRPSIWRHFVKTGDYATSKEAKCIHCNKKYANTNSATTSMWRHVRRMHPNALDVSTLAGTTYTKDTYKAMLVRWIAHDALPFTVVESEPFREVACLLRPDAETLSADAIREETMLVFSAEQSRVHTLLREAPGKLSFTADVWTAANSKGAPV